MESLKVDRKKVGDATKGVFWALGILVTSWFLLGFYADFVSGNTSSTINDKSRALSFARLCWFAAGLWYIHCFYRLSLALAYKISVAFLFALLQLLPVVNLLLLFFILFKAWKVAGAGLTLSCPSCSENVNSRDVICKFCNHSLSTDQAFTKLIQASNATGAAKATDENLEKNRIASEGFEAFKVGAPKSTNPYRRPLMEIENPEHASFWNRGYKLAENRMSRGEPLLANLNSRWV